jgi:hypothetical protein
MFPNPVENNKRYIGLIDELNGMAIGLNGTEFSIFKRRDGEFKQIIPQSQFNINKLDGSGDDRFVIDVTKLNVFRISYGYLGVAPITFEVLSGSKWIPFHKIEFANVESQPHLNLPYLKFRAYNVNEGNTENVSVYSASIAVGTIGQTKDFDVSSRDFTVSVPTASLTSGSTTIVVFHTKPTYSGVENRVESLLNLISASTDMNKSVTVQRFRLINPPTGGTWTDVDPNSFMEYSLNTVPNYTGAELSMPFELQKVEGVFETTKIENLNLRMQPDSYTAYRVTTTGSGTFNLSVGWKELH